MIKRIIFVLSFLAVSIIAAQASPVININDLLNGYAQLPQALTTPTNWTEDAFSAGDTTGTFDVNHAAALYLMARDSSMTGTDSLWLGIQVTLNNGLILKAAIAVHNLATTTITTYITNPLIPGDNTTVCYVWYPTNTGNGKFTGTMFLARLNGVNAATPYTPVTRIAWAYE